jgi:colanic acid biosynthesis glycosyl transferase WcaI
LPNVVFVPGQPREEVPAFISAADVCLVALRREPFLAENFVPSKIFEFLGCGRPVLASVSGEAAAIIQRARAGKVVAPEDPSALAEAIVALSEDRAATRAMGARGAIYARHHYDRAVLARRYLEVLGSVIGEPHGQPNGKPSGRARIAA